MQLQEIKALLATTDQFAISPTAVDRQLPRGHEQSRRSESCPLGLVKATVLETSHGWVEQTTFGCTGRTHPVERRTGVLVRIKRADLESGVWHRGWDQSRKTHVFKLEDAQITISLERAEKLIAQLHEHGLIAVGFDGGRSDDNTAIVAR